MKIRQYTAATMQEAILKIKVDLGPNAVILHTRKIKRGGFMGMFSSDAVEVLAAIDPNEAAKVLAGQADRAEKPREYEPVAAMAEALVKAGRAKAAPMPEIELGPHAVAGRGAPSRGATATMAPPALMHAPPALMHAPPALMHAPPALMHAPPDLMHAPPALMHAPPVPMQAPSASSASDEDVWLPAGPGYDPTNPRRRPDAPETNENWPRVAIMPESSRLVDEVSDLKSTVGDLKLMVTAMVSQLESQPRTAAQFPTCLQKVYDKLMACDVEPSIARGLTTYLQKEHPHLKTFDDLVDALEMPIAGLVNVSGPLKPVAGTRKVVALIGPTGVGKTTTIAKLAANFALSCGVDMALLTIDTYRVAAIEQLKTYGDIIGLPVDVVLTPQSLKEALARYESKDLILIDTAGRSPHNRLHINELRSFMDGARAVTADTTTATCETHLVLAATTRLADLKQIVKQFTTTGVDRILFTKTDETDVVGGIISIAHETGLPVSYITTGQSVPDDIMVADGEALARMLVQQLKG